MHGEENNAGGERVTSFDLRNQFLERNQVDAAQADALGRERKDCAPEFFARARERGDDDGSGAEGGGGLGGGGHGAVKGNCHWEGGELQTEPRTKALLRVRGLLALLVDFLHSGDEESRTCLFHRKQIRADVVSGEADKFA